MDALADDNVLLLVLDWRGAQLNDKSEARGTKIALVRMPFS